MNGAHLLDAEQVRELVVRPLPELLDHAPARDDDDPVLQQGDPEHRSRILPVPTKRPCK